MASKRKASFDKVLTRDHVICNYFKLAFFYLKDSVAIQSDKQDLPNLDETYTNLIKDADKLKLMLLAWNYQNSAAVQNGTSGPDLATMTNLWEQYQNALGISMANKSNNTGSPVSCTMKYQPKLPNKIIPFRSDAYPQS